MYPGPGPGVPICSLLMFAFQKGSSVEPPKLSVNWIDWARAPVTLVNASQRHTATAQINILIAKLLQRLM